MTDAPCAIDPRRPYLNLRWNMRDIDTMRSMYLVKRLDAAEIARRFSKGGVMLTSTSEVNEIIERNGWTR